MPHILKRLAAAACMTLTLGIAFAGQPLKIESIPYEPQANVNGEQLLLNGAGLRTKIFFKVYTAGLYLKAPARRNTEVMAQNSAARVRLGLLRDVSCASFIDSLNDGIKANLQPAKEKAISAGLEALRSLMRSIGDVKTGDIIDFDYSPDKGTTVHLNDKPVGEPIGGGRGRRTTAHRRRPRALQRRARHLAWRQCHRRRPQEEAFEIRRLNALKNTTARNRKVSGRLFIEGLRVIRP